MSISAIWGSMCLRQRKKREKMEDGLNRSRPSWIRSVLLGNTISKFGESVKLSHHGIRNRVPQSKIDIDNFLAILFRGFARELLISIMDWIWWTVFGIRHKLKGPRANKIRECWENKPGATNSPTLNVLRSITKALSCKTWQTIYRRIEENKICIQYVRSNPQARPTKHQCHAVP